MKNFLNRLTRLMIIMLMLVDRTPFLNVYAELNVVSVPPFSFEIDLDGKYNAGEGKYDYTVPEDQAIYWDYNFYIGQNDQDLVDFLDQYYDTRPDDLTSTGQIFNGFEIVQIVTWNGGAKEGQIKTVGIVATFTQLPIPTANPDNFTINEDNSITFTEAQLMANDTVTGPLTLDVTSYTNPANGSLVHDGASSFTYTPNTDFFGSDSFTYTLNGMTAVPSATTTVNFTINAVNDAPVAVANNYSTVEDTPLVVAALGVLGNDTDVENNPLTAILVSGTSNGTLALNANGSFTYTPNANFNGNDSFTYKANDGSLDSDTVSVSITVDSINDLGVANNDTASTDEDIPVDINVLANDTDVDNNMFVFSVTNGTNGTTSINGDGSVRYAPNANWSGTDTFTYRLDSSVGNTATVTVTVRPVDDAPVAVNDAATTAEDTSVIISVLGNDTDIDGGPKNVESFVQPSHGSVVNNAGVFTYIPTPNYNGSDSFTYTLNGGSTATVFITVSAVDDAPVAVNDALTIPEDLPVDINVLANDTDVDGGQKYVDSFVNGSHGLVSLNGDGTLRYDPIDNYVGEDSFTYTLNGGSTATVTITITATNDAPVANDDTATTAEDTMVEINVLANDTDPDTGDGLTITTVSNTLNGTAVIVAGKVQFTPAANFVGTAGFDYTITDDELTDTAHVTITVTAVNDAPVANDDTYSTNEDVTLNVAAPGVMANDTDIDGPSLSVSYVSGPAKGSLTLYPDGSFTYVPESNDFGIYTFTYLLSDGLLSDTATVEINVVSREDDPIATPKSFDVNEGQQYSGSVTGVDGDGDPLTFHVDTDPSHGTLVLQSTGSFTYTHDGTETPDIDKFTFKVSDDDGATFSAPADVNIRILDVNDVPVASNDSYTTDEDTALTIAASGVLINDVDEDSTLTTVKLTNPSKGTVVLAADGSFVYTPNANANGLDSFTYQAFDGTLYSNIATVTINITAVNDKPIANAQTLSTAEDTALPIVLTGSDVETALVDLVFTVVSAPSHGSISGTGSNISYTPNLNYNGPDSFTFTVSDGSLTSDPATIAITVTAVNDAPVAVLDSYTTNEDTLLTVPSPGILGNDDDVDDDPLTIEVVDDVTDGTLVVNDNGSFTYTPDANFNGTDSFTYYINDGTVDSNTVTVTITVNAFNDRPVANDQSLTTPEDTTLNITLTGTDTEGSSLLYGVSLAPSHGTLSGTAPNLVYTPAANYTGSDSFVFGISDGFYRDYATITINVTPVNDRPVAQNGTVTTPEDTAVLINFVASDVETSSLIYGISEQPLNGVLSGSGSSRTYTPNANFVGTDTFVFGVSDGFFRAYGTITVNVTPVNDAPVALSDLYATNEDTALVVLAPGILGNDADVEGSPLTAVLVDDPDFATSFTLNSDGSFTYTPLANFSGLDSFTYIANDGELDSNVATVTINVLPDEDAPVAVDDPDVEDEIEAFETPEDTPLVLTFEQLLDNDYDPDDEVFFQPQMFRVLLKPVYSFDFNSALNPSVGSLTLDMTGRTVTFTPPLNYVGPATFQYTIIDEDDNVSEPATVFIEVTPVNDAPVASPLAFTIANAGSSTGQLVASDVDDTDLVFSLLAAPTNGTATVSPAGVYTYTHNGTATLSDSFTFSVTDGELSATATVTVTITAAPTPPPVNLPPIANALAFTIANGAVSTGTLSGSDPEGAPISFAIASLPANGSLTISPAGIYVYDHNGTATTSDSFTFTVSDGSLTATATVSITILPIPTPPTAGNTAPEVIDGVVSTPFGEVIEGSVAPLGSDADGDDLTFALVDGPTNGTLVFNPDGTYTYTPNDGFDGSDSFTFITNDGTDDSDTATLTINVIEEEVIVEEPETPLAAPDNNWLWWLLALLAGLLLWLLAFLRPNMKYTLSDKANNQKVVRRRLAKPNDKTMIVELNDKDMVGLATIEVEFFKRLAKHCGDVTVKFMLKGTQVHSVTIPADIDDVFTSIIHL